MSSLLTESQVIPREAREKGLTRCFVYNGPSMSPTFHPGHLLYARPTAQDISPGDVIIFGHPFATGCVVHRVVATTDQGFVTRGDNNSQNDTWTVPSDRVIGRVEMLETQRQLQSVRGGWYGLWSVELGRRLYRVGRIARHFFGAPYRWLRRSETVHHLLVRLLNPRFDYISLHTPKGVVVKITHRGRMIARWLPNEQYFECTKPYDLVLHREDLPSISPLNHLPDLDC